MVPALVSLIAPLVSSRLTLPPASVTAPVRLIPPALMTCTYPLAWLMLSIVSAVVLFSWMSPLVVLAEEGRVELRNFGVFAVKKRKSRQGRNPRTGEKVMVGERITVTFKPGLVMEERVSMERGGGDPPKTLSAVSHRTS